MDGPSAEMQLLLTTSVIQNATTTGLKWDVISVPQIVHGNVQEMESVILPAITHSVTSIMAIVTTKHAAVKTALLALLEMASVTPSAIHMTVTMMVVIARHRMIVARAASS